MELGFRDFSRKWSLINSILNIVGITIAWYFRLEWFWWLIVSLSFAYLISRIPKYSQALPLWVGYANIITIIRLCILMILLFLNNHLSNEVLFFGFLLVVIMDGIDGWVARRFGQTSQIGEHLDMETDAFMVFALSWLHFQNDLVGWWILIPGGMRYYVELLLHRFLMSSAEPLPKRVRSTVAVMFFLSLVSAFILDAYWATLLLQLSSILILASFGMSILLRITTR